MSTNIIAPGSGFANSSIVSYNFNMLEIIDTGIIYANPIPHLKSVHAYFPSVAQLPDGKLIAVYSLGEAFEALNLHTYYSFSYDGGRSWHFMGQFQKKTKGKITSDASRITITPDGELVVLMCVYDRTKYRKQGLTNPETLGFVPTHFYLFRSIDGGKTFTKPKLIKTPIEGPSFELCCPIVIISDKTWLLPTSTWKAWNGYCPSGIKAIAMISTDEGKTWKDCFVVMDAYKKGIIFWESKIIEMPDGNLLAVAWAYDLKNRRDLPDHYTISKNCGKTWSKPLSTKLHGQTLTPMVLKNGRILSVYRRMDKPGLWANISRLERNRWINESETPIWGTNLKGLTGNTKNPSTDFHVLKFGAPSMIRLNDGSIFLTFWCYENCISVIRWFKILEEK
ncbi:MAG: glycoside hydrolase [Candidatus Omnitrophica bacterium]|nr:glycoside hydrolase [Candidatus Omnitrophota bacterium]